MIVYHEEQNSLLKYVGINLTLCFILLSTYLYSIIIDN